VVHADCDSAQSPIWQQFTVICSLHESQSSWNSEEVKGFIDRYWTIEDFEVAAKIEVAVTMVESVTKKNPQQVVLTCSMGKGLV
jgi:DNA phosphorothioation-dependent restriction protein DptG